MAEIIEAQVIQKIATPDEWATDTRIPYKGEIMLVGDSTGKVVNIKVGDGFNVWSLLEYMFDSIQQNVNYYPVSTLALPTPVGGNVFSIVVEGDYTFGGSPAFTVPVGSLGVIYWDGSVWALQQTIELPTQDLDEYAKTIDVNERLSKKIDKDFLFNGTQNLFSTDNITEGELVLDVTGLQEDSDSSVCYIPVEDSKTYTIKHVGTVATFLDISGAQIKPNNFDGSPRATYTLEYQEGLIKPPTGAVYLVINTKVNGVPSDTSDIRFYEGTGLYEPLLIKPELIPALPYVTNAELPAKVLEYSLVKSIQTERGNYANPALVQSDKYVFVSDGRGIVDSANWKTIVIPVEENTEYYIKGWNTAQTGMALIKGDVPVPPVNSPDYIVSGRVHEIGFPEKVGGSVVITTLPLTTFLAFTVRATTESDSVFASLMVSKEDGPYIPYDPNDLVISGLNNIPLKSTGSNTPSTQGSVKALITNDNVYVRIPFDSTSDLVHKVAKTNDNGIFNFQSVRAISKSESDEESSYEAGASVHINNDNISPMMLEEVITLSGNHGIASGGTCTAVGHGKTNADLFSRWSKGADVWILVEIVDANTLNFYGAEEPSTNGTVIPRNISTGTCVHISGATNTADVVITARTVYERKPAVRSSDKFVYVDGTPIQSNGLYQGEEVRFSEKIMIPDYRDPVLVSPFDVTAAPAMIEQQVDIIYDNQNNVLIEYLSNYINGRGWHVLREGYIQNTKLVTGFDSSSRLMGYFPNSNNSSASGTNINFRVPFNFTAPLGGTVDVYFGSSVPANNENVTVVEDINKPVERMIQNLEKATGEKVLGSAHGYPHTIGVTRAEVRKNHAEQWDLRNNTGKSYPRGIYEFTPNGEVLHAFAYLSYFDPKLNPNATSVYWIKEGSSWVVYLDYHTALSKEKVNLPNFLHGKTIEVLDTNTGIEILSGDIVPTSGLLINTTLVNGYAYAILRLT